MARCSLGVGTGPEGRGVGGGAAPAAPSRVLSPLPFALPPPEDQGVARSLLSG